MACEGNNNKIPIDINKGNTLKLSKNLSRFTYDFNYISKININEGNLKGSFSISNGQKAIAHMPTMGKLDLLTSVFFMKSINKYDGKHMDMEVLLIFMNRENKLLFVFIPIKKENTSSKSAKLFSQFAGFITNSEDSREINQEISVNNFNFNDIIPQACFISYKAAAPYLGTGCKSQANMIFFEKVLTIKNEDYQKLEEIFGINDYVNLDKIKELNNTHTNSMKNSKNFIIKTISPLNAFFDYRGTKNGPGLKSSNETLPLICTPVEDENGDSVCGSRLDWVKGSFSSISPNVKNMFYLILIVGILIGAMVFLHSFIFKSLGKMLGDEAIVTRSASLS
uniref:Alpha-carbonic anhydrase domain-containing protein n=1 Tax=viral metagenome TaxID=1070528 RepID=A0A6C0FA95_9ZZZZ|tara:strand:+ start:14994 stop:16007 length:1014 start_codon:yes stop_codon:yes gene_type:complete